MVGGIIILMLLLDAEMFCLAVSGLSLQTGVVSLQSVELLGLPLGDGLLLQGVVPGHVDQVGVLVRVGGVVLGLDISLPETMRLIS